MASKFAKEEEVYYLPANTDSESEEESNNSKANTYGCSPSSYVQDQIHNDLSGRSGGPCSDRAQEDKLLKPCGHCAANKRVEYTCGHIKYLCSYCFENRYFTCEIHPNSYRKTKFL